LYKVWAFIDDHHITDWTHEIRPYFFEVHSMKQSFRKHNRIFYYVVDY
jgi:hypothetical protein